MFAEADKNDDGRIDFEEFSAMMILSVVTSTDNSNNVKVYEVE